MYRVEISKRGKLLPNGWGWREASATRRHSATPEDLRAQAGEDNLEDAFVRLIGSEEGLHA